MLHTDFVMCDHIADGKVCTDTRNLGGCASTLEGARSALAEGWTTVVPLCEPTTDLAIWGWYCPRHPRERGETPECPTVTQTTNTDVAEIECPWCGCKNDWTDVQTDGCLKPGHEDECGGCGKPIRIDAVDWDPTIWVSRKEG